jgi:hypothetical protein
MNNQVNELLAALGADAENASIVSDSWALGLMAGGCIVDCHIGRWGGKTTLTPEDLGIKLSADPATRKRQKALFNLGEKFLLPQKTLNQLISLEVRARKNSRSWGIQTFFGTFFSPTAYRQFKNRHDAIAAEAKAIWMDVIENYDTIKEQMKVEYEIMAQDAWRRMRRQGPEAVAPEAVVKEYVERVMAKFPSRQYIENSWRFEAVPTIVPLPSMLAADMAAADTIKADAIRGGANVSQAILDRALQDDVAAYWHERKRESIDGFLVDIVAGIRQQVYDSLMAAKETASRNGGTLPGKTVQALKTMVETVTTLDPYGDLELEMAFRKMQKYLDADPKVRDTVEIVRLADDLATVLHASLALMDRAPRTTGDSDLVAELPTVAAVRQARESLGLAEVAPAPIVAAAMSRQPRTL